MFPVSWDRLDRRTLHFVAPELERAYQRADQVESVRRARAASLLAVPVWMLVPLIGPPALGIAAGSAWWISGGMIAFLLGCAGASRWATTQTRRSLIGLGQQVLATTAALTLATVTDTFATYAMPAVMLTAVFGFAVTRPAFLGSIGLGVFYCLSFIAFAAASSLGTEMWLQLFIVLATIVTGLVGAYLLE